jgi:hypothetical protein
MKEKYQAEKTVDYLDNYIVGDWDGNLVVYSG